MTHQSISVSEIELFLRTRAAQLLKLGLEEVLVSQNLISDLYMDSLKATQLAGMLGDWLGTEIDPAQFYEAATIGEIAQQVASVTCVKVTRPEIHVVVSASFTAEPVKEFLSFWLERLFISPKISFAPYNQVFQQLLNPASAVRTNAKGITIILPRIEDWFHFDRTRLHSAEPGKSAEEFLAALREAAAGTDATFIVGLCPHSPETMAAPDIAETLNHLDAGLRHSLAAVSGVRTVNLRDLEVRYEIGEVFDPVRNQIGHIPFTNDYFAALGTELARTIFSAVREPYKVIALDCDNTLWGGVCGEDGPNGIRMDPQFIAVQEFMGAQQAAGKLLCLCSKNGEEDVRAVFESHPAMPLKMEQIVAWKVNFEPKSENLKALADELRLGLDSFIFVDDSPVECAEVMANAPEVLVVQLPKDPNECGRYLGQHWAFDLGGITAEDRSRTRMYLEEHQRSELRRQSGREFDRFLEQLDVRTRITPLSEEDLPRGSQLTQRTNQFNATGIRRSEAELRALVEDPAYECFTVRVSDRFGEYGLVGLLVLRKDRAAKVVEVDSFLLSCRALGRKVEHAMARHAAVIASGHGFPRIVFRYRPSPRNKPVREFFESWKQEWRSRSVEEYYFAVEPHDVERFVQSARAEYQLQGEHPTGAQAFASNPGVLNRQTGIALNEIASLGGNAANLVRAARSWRVPRPSLGTRFVAPQTYRQKQVAAIWCDILRLQRVGIHDNFYELGGDSLLSAELFARLWNAGMPEKVSLSSIPELTVSGLAKALEEAFLGKSAATGAMPAALVDEARWPETIPIRSSARNPLRPAKAILLTGASGYFGAYLLAELLGRTAARVYCHVRSQDAGEGKRRIERNLKQYGLWKPCFSSRIAVVPGDLALPALGTTQEQFDALAERIDCIFHNGAWVNFILPYNVLKPANVTGTETVLHLAAKGRAKELNFISTLGVLMSGARRNGRRVSENEELDNAEDLPNGYEQSKWVADKMVMAAIARGLPASIYRLGMLSGPAESGTYHKVNEFLPSFLKGCLQMGSFPEIDTKVEMVPIDFAARATVGISQNPENIGRVFHLNHPCPITALDFATELEQMGYPLRVVPWEIWKHELLSSGARLRQNALYPFVSFIASLEEHQTQMPEMTSRNFLQAIAGNLDCPSQPELIRQYFEYFWESKFIMPPAG